jgi:hypothetical protein
MTGLTTASAELALAQGLWLKPPRLLAARLIVPDFMVHRGSPNADATRISAVRNQT